MNVSHTPQEILACCEPVLLGPLKKALSCCDEDTPTPLAAILACLHDDEDIALSVHSPLYCVQLLERVGAVICTPVEPDNSGYSCVSEVPATSTMDVVRTPLGSVLLHTLSEGRGLAAAVREMPQYSELLASVMCFCSEPRPLADIEAHMNRLGFSTAVSHDATVLYPSRVVDCLHSAGLLTWDGGWKSTAT